MTTSGIVVGIDGSAHSRRALEWAVTEAAVRHLPLRVLSVYQTTAAPWGSALAPDGDGALAQGVRKSALKETEQVLDALDEESRPPSVTVLAVSGIPAEELLRAADDAQMIVVGSRGAGGFRRLLVGSVASQVVHHANCPVVTVPPHKR